MIQRMSADVQNNIAEAVSYRLAGGFARCLRVGTMIRRLGCVSIDGVVLPRERGTRIEKSLHNPSYGMIRCKPQVEMSAFGHGPRYGKTGHNRHEPAGIKSP